MENLLRFVEAFVVQPEHRAVVLDDPWTALDELDDVTGEDIDEALAVVREMVDPELATLVDPATSPVPFPGLGLARDETPADVALRSLRWIAANLDGDPDAENDELVEAAMPGRVADRATSRAEDREFAVLELVSLPHGLAEHDIEPGSAATVVAIHREPELRYEVEVNDAEGARRFLGIVDADAVRALGG